MPNYLETAGAVIQAGRNLNATGGFSAQTAINAGWAAVGALQSGQNPVGAAINSQIARIPGGPTAVSALNSLTGGALQSAIGGITGTKPVALHTEYAAGTSNNPTPYRGGQDIVFYLMRADAGAPAASGVAAVAATAAEAGPGGFTLTDAETPLLGADISAGANLPDGMQSPLNQLASAYNLATEAGAAVGEAVNSGLVGPMSGLSATASFLPTGISQSLSSITSTAQAVGEVVSAGTSAVGAVPDSLTGGEQFFSDMINSSFNPGSTLSALGSVSSIASSVSNASFSSLASDMSVISGGIASTKSLVEKINHSTAGFTTSATKVLTEKIGPQGLSQVTMEIL